MQVKIEPGKYYRDRWGDIHGPMDERTPECFLDQHGAVYQSDGRQWNHLSESMSTIIEKTSTVTIVLPSGYATAEEFAKDCGFQLSAPELRAAWTDDYVKLLQRQLDEYRADVMSGALASPARSPAR